MDFGENKHNQKSTKVRFEYEDNGKDEIIEEAATTTGSSSILEEDSAMCEPSDDSMIGADKTSADYYFDSYSHFGIYIYIFLLFFNFFVLFLYVLVAVYCF